MPIDLTVLPILYLCNGIETPEIPKVIDLFVNTGADVNVRNYDAETPLLNAVINCCTLIARKLIELGTDVNIPNHSSNDTAIHPAVSFDHTDIVPVLINKGADYRARNIYGRNILHMLNSAGLDTSLKDNEGKTFRDYLAEREILTASEVGLYEIFEKLLASVTSKAPPSTGPVSSTSPAGGTYDLESRLDPVLSYYVPGAYPVV